ncbi:MAG: MASE1 domain-containing protein [Dehalococcoidia bacterium]
MPGSRGPGLTDTSRSAFRLLDTTEDATPTQTLAAGVGLLLLAGFAYFIPGQVWIWLSDGGFWPPAGVGVAMLIAVPRRRWPWVLAGIGAAEGLGSWIGGYPLAGAPFWTAGNLLEQVTGASLFLWFNGGSRRLLPLRSLLTFVACCTVAGPALGAAVGSVGGVIAQGRPWLDGWLRWFVGDGLGVLVIAPLLLTRHERPLRERRYEMLGLTAGVVVVSLLEMVRWRGAVEFLAPYLAIPLLTWGALRLGIRSTARLVFLFALIVNVALSLGYGPFYDFAASPAEARVLLQMFTAISASTTLILTAVVHDLSDREEVERGLRELADSMPQLVWTADGHGRLLSFNRRGSLYGGVSTAEGGLRVNALEVHTLAVSTLVHPDDAEATRRAWMTAIAHRATFEHEHRLEMADGAYRWHLSRAEPVSMPGRTFWYGTSTDIHELKTVSELKDQFIALASHELRNPVAAIHGLTQLMRRLHLRGSLTQARQETFTEELVASTAHLSRLTADLMDVSKLRRGSVRVRNQRLRLDALLQSLADSDDWQPRQVTLQLELDLPPVLADAGAMRQVVSKLLANALKYSGAGEAVVLGARRDRDGVLVEVVDRGIGISPQDLKALFEPFARGSNSDGVQGLGLGLYLSHQLIELQGGTLVARSAGLGQGTTMQIWLPADLEVPQATDPQALPEEAAVPSA